MKPHQEIAPTLKPPMGKLARGMCPESLLLGTHLGEGSFNQLISEWDVG